MNHYVNHNSDNIINEINQKIDQLDPNKSGPGVRGNSPSAHRAQTQVADSGPSQAAQIAKSV